MKLSTEVWSIARTGRHEKDDDFPAGPIGAGTGKGTDLDWPTEGEMPAY